MMQITPLVDRSRVTCACMMIVRDAERTIERSIRSILGSGCFDQVVIILDSRTKDRTARILQTLCRDNATLQVVPFRWRSDDFSAARNEALKLARTDYGFWMDADDVLIDSAGLYSLLSAPMNAAYYFDVISPVYGGDRITTPHLRLFPIRAGVRWELPVHEQIVFSIRRLRIREIPTEYRILHLGYMDLDTIELHHKRNFQIMRKWLSTPAATGEKRTYIQRQYNLSRNYLRAVG